jgi:hypothetical protein
MGTTARESPREHGKERSCPSDGRSPSVVVLQSAWGELGIERAALLTFSGSSSGDSLGLSSVSV